jgi:transcriptional regulator with XRE-family HTH domain
VPEKTFGSLLTKKRQELSLSRQALADRLGVTAAHVSWLETGHRRPSLRLLQRVVDNLDLDGPELFILCYPTEARDPWKSGNNHGPGKPDTVWKRFATNKGLCAKERISAAELKVLEAISRLGRVSSERQLLLVLQSIRLSFEDD